MPKFHTLELTVDELAHLRDLFSVVVSVQTGKTMSQSLADMRNWPAGEEQLWDKLVDLCRAAKIAIGEDAPNIGFIVPEPVLAEFTYDDEEDEEEDEVTGEIPVLGSVEADSVDVEVNDG